MDECEATVAGTVTPTETSRTQASQLAQRSTNLMCNANNPQERGNHTNKAKRSQNQKKALARARNLIAKAEAADLAVATAQATEAVTAPPVQTLSGHTNVATPVNTQIKEIATSENANPTILFATAERTPEATAGAANGNSIQATTPKPGNTEISTSNQTNTDTINLHNNLITTLNPPDHQTISLTEWVTTMLRLFSEVLSVPENQRWGKLMTGFMIIASSPRA